MAGIKWMEQYQTHQHMETTCLIPFHLFHSNHYNEPVLLPSDSSDRLCICAIQSVNGPDKLFKCLWTGYGSRCQAHQFECAEELQSCWVFHAQQFPVCIKNGPTPKGHPYDLTQLWEALESSWASIPMEHFWHLVESMHWWSEAVLRAKGGAAHY